jgi:peptidyl-prolyl cis-trans isomerase A (cyclophilin A)
VDSLYSGYGEGAPSGKGPDQNQVQMAGNTYLNASFPKLDFIKKAVIVE